MSHARATFAPDLASVREARRFVRRALVELGAEALEFEATQVVSELATNAVIHARTSFDVDLSYEDGLLRIAVSDGSTRSPVAKSHSAQAATGRGLKLVEALADQWGTEPTLRGKVVWCCLRPNPSGASIPLVVEVDDLRTSGSVPTGCSSGGGSARNRGGAGIAA